MEQNSETKVFGTIAEALNAANFNVLHLKAIFASAMGFFTSAYDLFIIGTALALIKDEWHLSTSEVGLVGSITLIATLFGAIIFGKSSDKWGRKSIYGLEAILMTLGAILSAFAPNYITLVIFRFILGLGIGGDYPLSAVLMSEYANQNSRGRMVSMVFSAQALGLVFGPAVALTLLAAGIDKDLAWRIMLGLGALPAASVIYIRRTIPESPRWLARVKGESEKAAKELVSFSLGTIVAAGKDKVVNKKLSEYILPLIGTAGSWFLFDYAYYGNTISTPLIMKHILPHSNILSSTAMSLIIFSVFAVPGYILSIMFMDKIGHKKLQLIGFIMLGISFALIGIIPGITNMISMFLIIYGLSYFFSEFGPNTTTFVIPAEIFPVNLRTTAHGISAGMAKVGAFIGAFTFPILLKSLGLSHTLLITAAFAFLGAILTQFTLEEPSQKAIEDISKENTPSESLSPKPA